MDCLDTLCKFVDTHEAHGEAIEDSARIDEQGRSIMTLRCRMCGASIEIELYEQNTIEADDAIGLGDDDDHASDR